MLGAPSRLDVLEAEAIQVSTVRAVLDAIHHTLEVEALTERGGAGMIDGGR